jgi:hypothetical protein
MIPDVTIVWINVEKSILGPDHLINKDSSLYSCMKVVLSLTTIPPRFEQAFKIVTENLMQGCHEIWINIPKKYNRFPDWDGQVPEFSDPKVIINRDCEDLGPATKVFGPAAHLQPEDLIVYIDDDTHYDIRMVTQFLRWYQTDQKAVWALSGFDLGNYFKGYYPRSHGAPLDVVEGYGGVLVKADWIQKILPEFMELRDEAKFADDIVLSNLLHKLKIKLQTIFVPDCHIGLINQDQIGFGPDALHHQVEGGHKENYRRVMQSLEHKGKNYFDYKC